MRGSSGNRSHERLVNGFSFPCNKKHSVAGVSRSVTVTVAYLMSITDLDSKDALKSVRGAREIASPNHGFVKQLQDFEGRRLREVICRFSS